MELDGRVKMRAFGGLSTGRPPTPPSPIYTPRVAHNLPHVLASVRSGSRPGPASYTPISRCYLPALNSRFRVECCQRMESLRSRARTNTNALSGLPPSHYRSSRRLGAVVLRCRSWALGLWLSRRFGGDRSVLCRTSPSVLGWGFFGQAWE